MIRALNHVCVHGVHVCVCGGVVHVGVCVCVGGCGTRTTRNHIALKNMTVAIKKAMMALCRAHTHV